MTPRERDGATGSFSFKLPRQRRRFGVCLHSEFYVVQIPNGSRRWRSSGVMPPSQPANYRMPSWVFTQCVARGGTDFIGL
jgi:hypothetical protein